MSSDDGGAHGIVLNNIAPGQNDYAAADGDIVTISGVGAQAITVNNGDIQVACK